MGDTPPHVVGAVLCGGASTRMGSPKALVEVDGIPMARRVATALTAAGAVRVTLVGGEPAWAATLGLPRIADRWPGEGPLGGLATALLDVTSSADVSSLVVLVAACDQPWLDPSALVTLVQALDEPGTEAVAAVGDDGRRTPFPSAWRATAGPAVAALVRSGERRAGAAFGRVRTVDVPVASRSLADVDRPGDLEP